MKYHRYQINKTIQQVIGKGHPWVYRDQLSSAADVFESGDWLRLVDGSNQIKGYGTFESDGLVGIRVFLRGAKPPLPPWWLNQVKTRLSTRKNLRNITNSFRAIHGENDGLPGITIDVYHDTAVLQTYASSVDGVGRYVAQIVANELGIKHLLWRMPHKRVGNEVLSRVRTLRGHPPNLVLMDEGKLKIAVPTREGQKGGMFLDLRGLRRFLATRQYPRVLNLFSYTGTLGLACETGGSQEVWNVDISKEAIKWGEKHHSLGKSKWIVANVFDWLKTLPQGPRFDLIIIDPPNMASNQGQVKTALRQYATLHQKALAHLKPGGTIITACCTSRIQHDAFKRLACDTLRDLNFKTRLMPEDDHPVGFAEGDYLKIFVFENFKPSKKH